jgi:hypothetical protein
MGFPVDYSQLPDFFAEVARIPAGGVMWNGAWRDDVIGGTNAGIIPAAARVNLESSFTYGFTPTVVFGWRSGTTVLLAVPGNATNDWTNARAKELFRDMVGDIARTYQPPFVFLGNENDFYYEQNPADYANWIAWYDAAYDVIKAASPSTLVGPVFNYEHMAGSGALNGWTTTYWSALEMHDFTRVTSSESHSILAPLRHRCAIGRLSRPVDVAVGASRSPSPRPAGPPKTSAR